MTAVESQLDPGGITSLSQVLYVFCYGHKDDAIHQGTWETIDFPSMAIHSLQI